MTTTKKTVLITGANGLLGSNAARVLYRKGYDLKLMVRPTADIRGIMDIPCELFYGNITSSQEVSEAVKGCDYVVHTASVTGQWGVTYQEYKAINIDGTKNIVEASLGAGIKKLVYISTANTIGPGDKNKPGNELNAFSLFHLNSGYINSKYIAQQYVLEQTEKNKLPAVILNPTFMIGPYDTKPSSGQIIFHGINKKLIFYPPGGKNFVQTEDVCAGIVSALETGTPGSVYLMAGENLTYKEFFSLLNKITGQKSLMIRIPPALLKLAGMAGSLLQKFTGITTKLSYSSAYMLCLYNYYSGKKSERELKINYSSTESAIRSALTWFQENNYFAKINKAPDSVRR